jgi:hypothetical protein
MLKVEFIGHRFLILMIPFVFFVLSSCDTNQTGKQVPASGEKQDPEEVEEKEESPPVYALLVIPGNPAPGEAFRILATGAKNNRRTRIVVSGPSGTMESTKSKTGNELPYWRIDDFAGIPAGKYKATLVVNKKDVSSLQFEITPPRMIPRQGTVWKTRRGWNSGMEAIYSAWVNALFLSCDEQDSWPSLHEVTQDKDRNFLYNILSLGEDDPAGKIKVIMEPDCADNPFFLRAYFAWKLGLPFGYHICDRGWVGRSPRTGQWITNENSSSKSDPALAFNSFVRNMMNGVHSGTARTALHDENSDYYPVPLSRESLRPGTVFADPYGHTLILVNWVPQTKHNPGRLLAVDAQPDNTIAVKRFWKGNFLFNTSEVVGEPGFKAFRPVLFENGKLHLVKNEALKDSAGYAPFSLEQKNMGREDFYLAMERLINPEPLDPEEALTDLITALHEQLMVRVKSVANGEAYLKTHPGTVISMPSSANGVFLAGGPWEDYSTPNRDLRLLIAMDAVSGFPERVAIHPQDFKLSRFSSPEEIKGKLQKLLEEKVANLAITYTRSDGSPQELTVAEILNRKDAFEMAYNPNDCVEIRWGAQENSAERSTCRRVSPPYQQKTMQSVRKWFNQRLHPPT